MSEIETQVIQEVTLERFLAEIDLLKTGGWRIIQILCVSDEAGWELSYSFGLRYEFRSIRVRVAPGVQLPSITPYFAAAFLYENEIRDLFGAPIERISADWKGKVYDVASDKPFSKVTVSSPCSECGPSSIPKAQVNPTPTAEGASK